MKALIEKYKELQEELNEKINDANDCVLANPCSEVSELLDTVKSNLSQALNIDWTDEINESYQTAINQVLANIDSIKADVDTNWKKSDDTYKEIKEELEKLNTATKKLEDYFKNNKPKESDYLKPSYTYDENGSKVSNGTELNTSAYNKAMDKWKNECETLNRDCESSYDKITEGVRLLTSLSFTGELGTISFSGGNYNVNITGDMIEYTYNGTSFLIPNTNANINSFATQKPDQCLGYAESYIDQIFKKSSTNVPKGGTRCYAADTEAEALKLMYSEIAAGRPVTIQVNGRDGGGRHFVSAIGINPNADPNNLKQSDFLILDPAYENKDRCKVLGLDDSNSGKKTRYLTETKAGFYQHNIRPDKFVIITHNTEDDYATDNDHLRSASNLQDLTWTD